MPRVTFGMNTAQEDFPIVAYPDVHMFEFLMRQLRKQTFKDFEVVIADVNYEKRKDYFEKHPEKFPVKHVPVKPNIWLPFNSCAIATTKNTFLLHARGTIIISMGDCAEFDENYIMRVVQWIEKGYCVTHRYSINQGNEVVVKDVRLKDSKDVHGNVAMSTQDWLLINGYDEMFDGSKGSEDIDIGYRLITANKRTHLCEEQVIYQHHFTCNLLQNPQSLKCPEAWWYITRFRDLTGLYAANRFAIRDDEYELLCRCHKGVKVEKCFAHLRPCKRVDEEGGIVEGVNQRLFKLYKHPSLVFNLRQQREDVEGALEGLAAQCSGENLEEYLRHE